MKRTCCWAALVLGAAGVSVAVFLGGGPSSARQAAAPPAAGPDNEIIQEFPTAKEARMQTAWKIHWAQGTAKGLYITGAWFRKSPEARWLKVLGDARVSDIFVPYHGHKYPGFEETRFWDLSNFRFDLVEGLKSDAGPRGEVIGNPPTVIKELRDRGLMWKDPEMKASRRGEELVLWATLKAGNYAYVMQYGFRDDGSIGLRLGATSHNYPNAPLESHVHNGLWRIDVDLGDGKHNSVLLMRHKSPKAGGNPRQSEDTHELFNGGKEGWADWKPEEFTMLHIINTRQVNAVGQKIGYDLMVSRTGTARHYGSPQEECTHHDFYVTRSPLADDHPDDELYYNLLPTRYCNGEDIKDTDVILWCIGSMHHEPRSEDGKYVKDDKDDSFYWKGVTHVMWGGVDLMPRNIFDSTPLYP